jgi:hypothetical protein
MDHIEVMFFGVVTDELVNSCAGGSVTGQKKHGHGDMFGIDGDIVAGQFAGDEGQGKLGQDAGTITTFAIGSDGTTMLHVAKGGERHTQHIVTRAAVESRHKANTTGVVLKTRIIESAGGGVM